MNVPELLKSKQFWTLLIGVVLIIGVNIWPELAGREAQITNALLILIGLVVGGFTVTDVQLSRERVARIQAEYHVK